MVKRGARLRVRGQKPLLPEFESPLVGTCVNYFLIIFVFVPRVCLGIVLGSIVHDLFGITFVIILAYL